MRGLRFLIAAAAVIVACASSAQAAFVLHLSDGVTTTTYTPPLQDNPTGQSSGSLPTFSFNGYVISGLTYQRNYASGAAPTLQLHVGSISKALFGDPDNPTTTGTTTLVISLSSDGFTFPLASRKMTTTFFTQYASTAGAMALTGESDYALGSTLFAAGPPSNTYTASNTSNGLFLGFIPQYTSSSSVSQSVSGSGAYVLTNILSFTNFTANKSVFSGDVTTNLTGDSVNAAPAPSALLLAAFGLPAFGLIRRFTRKSPTEATPVV